MPLYEYQCGSCGSVFEVRQKFSDDPVTVHENCGGSVRRLLSAPTFQFKGSGWYITDYARAGKSGNGKSETGGEGKSSDAKAEAKGESKSDSKSDSSASAAKSTETAKPASSTPKS